MEQNFKPPELFAWNLQLISCRAEALLKLHQIEDADSCLSSIPKFEHYSPSCSTKFVCMIAEAYVLYVRAQVEMALGRWAPQNGVPIVK